MLIWIILLAIGTFVIAAAAIGSVTGSLATRPRRSVYDLEEAVDFVAERLTPEVTAQVSFDDVRSVLGAHCDYLAAMGVASERTADDIGESLVVVEDNEPVAWILGRLETDEVEVDDDSVLAILDVEQDYYRAIGAIGPAVTGEGP